MSEHDAADAREALHAAEALYAEGRLEESEAAFGALLGSEVRAEALYGLGMICYGRDDLSRAQALFEQSLGVERRRPDALYYLARTLLARGARENAVALLGEALVCQPSHEAALRDLAALANEAAGSAGDGEDTASTSREHEETAAPRAAPADSSGWPGATAPSPPAHPPSAPAEPPGPPRDPKDPSAVVGVVRQLSKGVGPWRGRPAAAQIWTFRLERYSQTAAPVAMVAVELRGHEITGTLENGDWVEISERPKPGEGFRPKELRNLTADDLVKARWRWFTN